MSPMLVPVTLRVVPVRLEQPCGLADHKLAGELHGLYTALWSKQLQYGDGTSVYNQKWSGSKLSKPDPKAPADICQREGHWWPPEVKGRKTVLCADCGSRKRADGTVIYPRAAPPPSLPEMEVATTQS
jgi:hypothetical protein